jgi:hypothetical protein
MDLCVSRRNVLEQRDEFVTDRILVAVEQLLEHRSVDSDQGSQLSARDIDNPVGRHCQGVSCVTSKRPGSSQYPSVR